MTYWYQKEYADGDLYVAFWDVVVIFAGGAFETAFSKIKIEELKTDSNVLELMLEQLMRLVVRLPRESSLVVKQERFMFKEGIDKDEVYCMCQKTGAGWLFKIGGGMNEETAVYYKWRKLSNEHPFAKAPEVCVGPSSSLFLWGKEM